MSKRRRGSDDPVSLFSFQDIITALSGVLILLVLIMAIQIAAQKAVSAKSTVEESNDPLKERIDRLAVDLAKVRELSRNARPDAVQQAREMIAKESELASRNTDLDAATRELNKLQELLKNRMQLLGTKGQQAAALAEDLEKTLEYNADMRVKNNVYFIPEVGFQKTPRTFAVRRFRLYRGHLGDPKSVVTIKAGAMLGARLRRQLANYDQASHHIVLLVKPSGTTCYDDAVEVVKQSRFDFGSEPIGETIIVEYEVM
jgi:TolA-binding protein